MTRIAFWLKSHPLLVFLVILFGAALEDIGPERLFKGAHGRYFAVFL